MISSVSTQPQTGISPNYSRTSRPAIERSTDADTKDRLVSNKVSTSDDGPSPNFRQLTEWMGGEFSSAGQAKEDPTRFEIDLGIRPIWEERSDEDTQYYYVEQAIAGDQPYRQRVYRLSEQSDNRFVSEIFELPQPELLVGKDGTDPIFATFGPDQLLERAGCDVILERDTDGHFRGSTEGSKCSSTYNGAYYTVSIVDVGAEGLLTLDQGYLQDGTKVWGAPSPYRFDRS